MGAAISVMVSGELSGAAMPLTKRMVMTAYRR